MHKLVKQRCVLFVHRPALPQTKSADNRYEQNTKESLCQECFWHSAPVSPCNKRELLRLLPPVSGSFIHWLKVTSLHTIYKVASYLDANRKVTSYGLHAISSFFAPNQSKSSRATQERRSTRLQSGLFRTSLKIHNSKF